MQTIITMTCYPLDTLVIKASKFPEQDPQREKKTGFLRSDLKPNE